MPLYEYECQKCEHSFEKLVASSDVAVECPECHGTLWELSETGLLRFRCRVGHAYSSDSMAIAQSESAEAALWTAKRKPGLYDMLDLLGLR